MPASLPAIPKSIDVDPAPLPQLPNGEMGTVVVDSAETTRSYGILATRFNTLREFYNCVRTQMNEHKAPSECVR